MKYTKTPLSHGYANQILTIDLGAGHINPQPLDPQIRDFFIGGRGLGLYLLHKKINAKTTE
jgi:aldehyde:ferredoxin oxidoreductase